MKRIFDWKYLLGISLAILPLLFSLYQWRTDLQGHDISLRLISSSSLQPLAKSEIYDVRMSVNGVELVNPHFSIIELTNTGSKPILSADFDTPIQFTGTDGLTFITARVDLTDPKDIPVKVTLDAKHVSLSPFLFNPADRVLISTITSGPDPIISVKGRVAGIRSLAIDSALDSGNRLKAGFGLIVSVLSLSLYTSYAWVLTKRVVIDRRFLFASALCCGVAGTASLKLGLGELEVVYSGVREYRTWIVTALFLAGGMGGLLIGKNLRRRSAELLRHPY